MKAEVCDYSVREDWWEHVGHKPKHSPDWMAVQWRTDTNVDKEKSSLCRGVVIGILVAGGFNSCVIRQACLMVEHQS